MAFSIKRPFGFLSRFFIIPDTDIASQKNIKTSNAIQLNIESILSIIDIEQLCVRRRIRIRHHNTEKNCSLKQIAFCSSGSFLSWLPLEILMKIYEELVTFWSRHIGNRNGGVYASVVAEVTKWPKYTGIYCNMMPFIMGQKKTIPSNMQQ